MAESVIRQIDWFKESRNIRKGMDEASLRELGESMLKHGQLQDVISQPDGTLICGHRRLAAAKLVRIATLTVKIVESAAEAGKVVVLQAIENEQRQNLTDPERWRMVEELRRLYPKWIAKDISEALHKDPSWVTRYLSPSKCLPAVQEAFAAGRLGISDCYAISKVTEREQHELLALKLGGATRDDLECAVKRINRPRRNGSGCEKRVRCPLATATVIVTGNAIGLDEAIDAVLAAAKEMKRARDEGLDAKTAQAVWEKRLTKAAG
jgi:ParB family transcriptional regulator, chromosome partitioning protein